MKLINYRCNLCHADLELLFRESEKIPEIIHCPFCDIPMEQFNMKNNKQVWRYDR